MSDSSWKTTDRPAIASNWVLGKPDIGTYLARSEGDTRVMTGEVLAPLISLIDGRRSVGDLLRELAPRIRPEKVIATLDLLESKGLLTRGEPPGLSRSESAYWRLFGANEWEVARRLPEAACRVDSLDGEAVGPIEDTLGCIGIRVSPNARFRLVLARNYLDSRLAAVNLECLATGTAWMLARPYGRRHWIGPLFLPGRTGCWGCLAWWLTINGWSASFVVAEVPALTRSTLTLVAAEAAKWLSTNSLETLEGRIMELDTGALALAEHRFQARPQCPHCHAPAPGAINLRNLISPLTGIACRLQKVREWPGLAVWTAQTSQMLGFDGVGGAYYAGPQTTFGAAEMSDEAATICLTEAAERYSVRFHGHERIVAGSFQEFGDRAVAPGRLFLASDTQRANRQAWNAASHPALHIPDHLDADTPTGWAEAVSLVSGERRYVPAGYVYIGYDPRFPADTNGCAAGATMEAAMLAGLLELIERDAVSLWWYNRARRPPVDVSMVRSRRIEAAMEAVRETGRSLHLLDLTSDFGIPVCVAAAAGEGPGIALGAAAHPDAECCLWKALAEMSTGMARLSAPMDDRHQWLEDARIDDFPHLYPNGSPVRYSTAPGGGTAAWLKTALDGARAPDLDVLALDLTQPELGIPVARIVVPGLRPLAPRLAPGRLYDVPVALGWLRHPLTEAEMNPMPFAL